MTECVRLIHVCYVGHNGTQDLIGHLILLLTAFIIVHICYYILDDLIALLLYCISSHYMHVHLPLYFIHLLGV